MVSPFEELIGYQLRRASGAMSSELARSLDTLGLRTGEAAVLLLIGERPHITQSEIGRELSIKRANMAPLAAGLERRGLIRRARVDGRSHGLSLTEEGLRTAESVRAIMYAMDERFLARLDPEQRAMLRSMLHTVWA